MSNRNKIYEGVRRIDWSKVQPGQQVYIDNFQAGQFPDANPRISGPYTVVDVEGRQLRQRVSGRVFMHYPENLLEAAS